MRRQHDFGMSGVPFFIVDETRVTLRLYALLESERVQVAVDTMKDVFIIGNTITVYIIISQIPRCFFSKVVLFLLSF